MSRKEKGSVRKMKQLRGRFSAKTVCALALAVVLSVGSVMPAFAAGDPIYGTEAAPAQAAITKLFRMPEGTETPAATFTFEIAKKSLNGSTLATDLKDMPTIADKSVTFSASDEASATGGIKDLYQEVLLFSNPTITFPSAGVYTYTITEKRNVGYDIADPSKESLEYSSAEYELSVYVKNGENGTYIYALGALIVTPDTAGQTGGDKVNPTPGGDPSVDGDYSAMVFTNVYLKSHGGVDPTDPSHQALAISKTTSGDFADRTKYFDFEVTMQKPATLSGAVTYTAYVVDTTSNEIVTTADNGAGMVTDADGNYFVFTAGTPQTISLKDNQKLVFVDTHVGTTYVAVEAAVADYKASTSIIVDGGTPIVLANSEFNQSLSTLTRILGEGTNSADFTNEYKEITVAGLNISDLPFIALLVVALSSLVVLVALKSRKRDDSNSTVAHS